MSGGYFNYKQYCMEEIADKIKVIINDYNFSDKTMTEFIKCFKMLVECSIYTQRIDWLLSGDDDEDTFHKRLNDELNK